MRLFNALVTGLFEGAFFPFRGLAPIWGLAVVSLLSGVLMLWIFGKVSNQPAIRVIRDRIRGQLIAIRLFGDDLGLLFRLQGRLLWDNAIFLRYAMLPLLVMLVPVLLILVQLDLRFSRKPLTPGEATVVKVKLADAAQLDRGVALEAPEGVVVETPAVRAAALQEVAWRVRAERPGRFHLRVVAGDRTVEKELRVGSSWGTTSELRPGHGLLSKLLHPGEPPIDAAGGVEWIEVEYDPLDLHVFGWKVHWIIVFFVVSVASGFAFRRVLGVEI